MAAEAFVITFREGIEAALMVSIVLAYLAKTGRQHANKWVYLGVVLGVIASLAEAVLVQSLFNGTETAQQSIIAGTTMLIASVLVITLLAWMWKTTKTLKKDTESKIDQHLTKGSMFGIFLLTFSFIFREGSETVLFLYSLMLKSDPTAQLTAGVIGWHLQRFGASS